MLRVIAVLLLLSAATSSQVRISIPGSHFKRHERIAAQISNTGHNAVSYCVEVGQYSFKTAAGNAEDIEATPMPFYVQKLNGDKWGTLLIGPDVGSSRHAVVLQPGGSQQFPFRLSADGQMRLVLDYWQGENDKACDAPNGKKTTQSHSFVVEP